MQANQHTDLWNRIRDFAMDDPQAKYKYSDKLAQHNGWSKDYTNRVIEEYKKFIFLCAILPGGASPSKPIDEAWHLHLTYTHSYWRGLCAGVLGKEIHHYPSKGGPEEKQKHADWYDNTIDNYRSIFGYDPPGDIWIRTTKPVVSTRIETTSGPGEYKQWYGKLAFIFLLPFVLITALYEEINPYRLTGPQFLLFFASLVMGTLIYLLLIRRKKEKEIQKLVADNYKGDGNIFQVARFVYGKKQSTQAAIVDLVDRKMLRASMKNFFTYSLSNYKPVSEEKNPLAVHLRRNARNFEEIHYKNLSQYYDEEVAWHDTLAWLSKAIRVEDIMPYVTGGAVLAVGTARVFQGISNDRPVAYLLIMCAIFLVAIGVTIYWLSSKRILQRFFFNRFEEEGNLEFDTTALAAAYLFVGIDSLSSVDGYYHLQSTFSESDRNRSGASGDGGSDWGSSGGSDGSDGGSSCGGGGCGGCGGGD